MRLHNWTPIYCTSKDILELIQKHLDSDTLLLSLIFEYDRSLHKISLLSEYDSDTGEFIPKFSLDDQDYYNFVEFKVKAKLGNKAFVAIKEPIRILCDEMFGDPHRNKFLNDKGIN